MTQVLAHWLGPALVLLQVGLFAWALVGLAEWVLPAVPWPQWSNPLFPRWLLLVHWLAVLGGAATFLGGYFGRWRAAAWALAGAYLPMAAVCAVETYGYLTHPGRFLAMAAEYAAYVAIPIALARVPALAARYR